MNPHIPLLPPSSIPDLSIRERGAPPEDIPQVDGPPLPSPPAHSAHEAVPGMPGAPTPSPTPPSGPTPPPPCSGPTPPPPCLQCELGDQGVWCSGCIAQWRLEPAPQCSQWDSHWEHWLHSDVSDIDSEIDRDIDRDNDMRR